MAFADLPPKPPILEALAFDLSQTGREPDNVDLRTVRPRCPVGRADEIVVCATDPEKERARSLPETYTVAEGLPRAEIQVGERVSLDLHLDAGAMPNGYTANRIMVGVKFKF